MQEKEIFSEFQSSSKEEWKTCVEKELKGKPIDSLIWKTNEGFDLLPFYTGSDIDPSSCGQFPVPRHKKPGNGQAPNTWEICERIDVANIELANKKARHALNKGVTSINFYINKINEKEFSGLLGGIIPEHISLHFSCKINAIQILNWYKKFSGESKNVRGSIISVSNEENSKLFVMELSGFSPFFRGITISSVGENLITKQISVALEEGCKILKHLIKCNFKVDEIASRIQFSFPVGDNYFFEIAKIRSFRILWARVIGQFLPQNVSSSEAFIHSVINPEKDSDKYNNFISNTSRVMSAAIGGADNICIESEDEFSRNVNRNIQLIAREEAYLNMMTDVAAGSYYIETLTKEITDRVCLDNPGIT